jgi:hypothetical protein
MNLETLGGKLAKEGVVAGFQRGRSRMAVTDRMDANLYQNEQQANKAGCSKDLHL